MPVFEVALKPDNVLLYDAPVRLTACRESEFAVKFEILHLAAPLMKSEQFVVDVAVKLKMLLSMLPAYTATPSVEVAVKLENELFVPCAISAVPEVAVAVKLVRLQLLESTSIAMPSVVDADVLVTVLFTPFSRFIALPPIIRQFLIVVLFAVE